MSWHRHHSESEQFASAAEMSAKEGNAERAIELYRLAAEAEVSALEEIDPEKTRTIGITAVSAAALYDKAGDYQMAQSIAERFLSKGSTPRFAADQLSDILQRIKDEPSRKGIGSTIDESSDHISSVGHTAKSSFFARGKDITDYDEVRASLAELIKSQHESLDAVQRVALGAKNKWTRISVALLLYSNLLVVAVGLYFAYTHGQIQREEYNRLTVEQGRLLKDSRLEVLRLQATVQIMPYLIRAPEYDRDIAPLLKSGNIVEAIAKVGSSGNQKARNAAIEILPMFVQNGGEKDRMTAVEALTVLTGFIYQGFPNEIITVRIESQNQPSKLTATLNGKELRTEGNALTFNLSENKEESTLLQLTFQGSIGDKYKVRIEGTSPTTLKRLVEQKDSEAPSIFIFRTI